MTEIEQTIVSALRTLLDRRGADDVTVAPESDIYDDLTMDSLEVAEFSAVLEDEFGRDPYSAGIVPRTVAEVIAFYGV